MTGLSSEIDDALLAEIVRRVVQRLRALSTEQTRSTVGSSPQDLSKPAEASSPELWCVSDRVVTMSTLRGRPATATRVRVGMHAVVTPAVRDEIRQRGWVLERESKAKSTQTESRAAVKPTPCFLQTPPGMVDGAMIERMVELRESSGLEVDQLSRQVGEAVRRSGRAVVVALEPYRLVCELNRDATVRAGYAPSTSALSKLVQQLRPNVIVIDARRITHAVIRGVIDELNSLPGAVCDRGGSP